MKHGVCPIGHDSSLAKPQFSFQVIQLCCDICCDLSYICRSSMFWSALQDGVLVENMHDVPWQRPDQLGPETTAAMTAVCAEVRRTLPKMPLGIQVLSCGSRAAIAVATVTGLMSTTAKYCVLVCLVLYLIVASWLLKLLISFAAGYSCHIVTS